MVKMNIIVISYFFISLFPCGCKKNMQPQPSPPVTRPVTDTVVSISTDKACYKPGEEVVFTINKNLPPSAVVCYMYLDSIITKAHFSKTTWVWQPPPKDFTGYIVEIYNMEGENKKVYGSIAVDVSSDWTHFPRYGFLSEFGLLSKGHMDSVMDALNRYHINGLQFYDWEYEHHQPLAGTVTNPDSSWKDIANRTNYMSTVQAYIALAHQYNMKAMSYNLAYGALNDATSAGVSAQWYLYTDPGHVTKYTFNLPMPPFKSDIYLLDPSNPGWQNYIAGQTNDMYEVYNFDGYHVDQLGNLNKSLYTYAGNVVNLSTTFLPFLSAMKAASPDKRLVMNAVNQYGQQESISRSPVDFLYTEVWSPNEGYQDLANIIQQNDAWSDDTKRTILAAYMDYDIAKTSGYFNTPGVLLTDAVIFSFGGAHIELGDHMLDNEYFPNSNLQMKPDLQKAITKYYDFLTGYENILRGNGTFNVPPLFNTDGKMPVSNWPPKTGNVSMIGKEMGDRQVIYLINFANASSFDWRDAYGTQNAPVRFQDDAITFNATKTVRKIWWASPDINSGAAQDIPFQQSGNSVSFVLPSLQYWDMIVVEY